MSVKAEYEKATCCICGSGEHTVIYPGVTGGEDATVNRFRSTKSPFTKDQIVKCVGCGLLYVNPRPKEHLIIKGCTEVEDSIYMEQDIERELGFKKTYGWVMKYVKKPGKVLDVGTASGLFLSIAKRDGWDVLGVELNQGFCEFARKHYGIDVKQGPLETHKLKSDSFDLVTIWDVIEHVPHPDETLKEINRVLKPRGHLALVYPDIGSWFARVLGSKWSSLNAAHWWQFDKRTIRLLLEKAGFEIITLSPYWMTFRIGHLMDCFSLYYSKPLGNLAGGTLRTLHLQNLPFSYWTGQSKLIARKK